MIKRHYSGNARRAANIIWNAAGRYDFDPAFMAFFPNGNPDHYFNMMIGLAVKYIGEERLEAFFTTYEQDRRRDEFDEYVWLGLENALVEKELPERPQLAALRKDRASRFFKEHASLSRQQMELQNMTVYTQQEIRWSSVLGTSRPAALSRDLKMAAALALPGTLGAEELLDALQNFLSEYFHYDPSKLKIRKEHTTSPLRFLFGHRKSERDRLIVRTGTGKGDHALAVQQRHDAGVIRHLPDEKDAAFIAEVFGKSAVTPQELRILENELCTGPDAACRLWVTKRTSEKGAGSSEHISRESASLKQDIQRQIERNEAYYTKNAAVIDHAVKDLHTKIETVFSSYFRHLPEAARSGQLRSEVAYRLPVLNDPKVFLKSGEETEPELCIDLLLDASQSRMNAQEMIAAEAYIIAESLSRLKIPVRVCAFRSLKNYTVVEILKDWKDTDRKGIFRYYAAGWNRDALALRTLERLEEPSLSDKKRMLLILTDASPNDTAPFAGEGLLLSHEYEGADAVKAAEDAVRSLRNDAVSVGAVFHGNASHLDDLHQIYGRSCVRIRRESQLADGVSDLLLLLLREMK